MFLNLDRYYGSPWPRALGGGAGLPRVTLLALGAGSRELRVAHRDRGRILGRRPDGHRRGLAENRGSLIYVTNVGLQHRNPYVLNNGDRLFVIPAALAVFLPWGARYSVDAWRRARKGAPGAAGRRLGPAPDRASGLLHLPLSCFAKLRYAEWRDGTAVRSVLSSPVFSEWPMRVDFMPLVQFLTWSTLAFEFLSPILVFYPRFRPYLLVAGLLFHAGIEITMTIPMFSAVMVATYACFLSDQEADALVMRAKRSVEALFFAGEAQRPSAEPDPTEGVPGRRPRCETGTRRRFGAA